MKRGLCIICMRTRLCTFARYYKMAENSNNSSQTEKICMTSTRIVHTSTSQPLCMKCFSSLTLNTKQYKLVLTHHFTNSIHHHGCHCVICSDNLIKSQPINTCSRCSQKDTQLSHYLDNVTFRYNIFTNAFEQSHNGNRRTSK